MNAIRIGKVRQEPRAARMNEKGNADVEAVKITSAVKAPLWNKLLQLVRKLRIFRLSHRGDLPAGTKHGVADFTDLIGSSQISIAVKLMLRAYAKRTADARCQSAVHPILVGMRLMEHGFGVDIVTVGILHDVLDSPGLVPADLYAFGMPKRVVDAVIGLTYIPEIESYDDYLSSVARDEIAATVLVYDIVTHGAAPKDVDMYPEDIIITVLGRLKHEMQTTGMRQK